MIFRTSILAFIYIQLIKIKNPLALNYPFLPVPQALFSAPNIYYRQAGFPKFPNMFRSPKTPSCGQRHVFHSPPKNLPNEPLLKIVGGQPVPYGAYPWTVHIESLSYDGFEHACGGTLIAEYYVITAAHCLHGYGYSEVRVKVGDYDSKTKDASERIFTVHSWKVHPKFQKGGIYSNDIAVMKLNPYLGKGVEFDQFVSPACLPTKHTSYPAGTWCYVSGWGLTSSDDFLPSNIMRAASVPLISKGVCRRRGVLGSKRLKPGMMCAGYLRGKIDTCNGDSGGPLVCNFGGQHTVLGVVSWGIDCAKENKPGIYSDVQYYLDFIKTAMKEL